MPATVDALLIKLDASTERLRREMERANRTVGRSAQRMDRSLRGVSAGFASMQRSVTALIPSLGVLAGAGGFAGLALGMRAAVREAEQTERQLLKISQIIKSTGGTAQLTANQIDEFARQLARATLATSDGVRDAAGALLSFRSISGETFTRTLSLAQDLSAVMGTSLQSNILQLGKALEDPIRGITALRRSGVSFTQAQQDLIKSLAETNRLAEAQDLILGELQKQVGGAGAAEAGGLSGAVDSLAQAWSEFLEGLGNSGAISAVTGLVRGLSESVTALRLELGLFVTGREEFEALLEERFRIEAQLAQPVSGRAKAGRANLRERLAEIKARLRELQDENVKAIKSVNQLNTALEQPAVTTKKGTEDIKRLAKAELDRVEAVKKAEQELADQRDRALSLIKSIDPFADTRDQLLEIQKLAELFPDLADGLAEVELELQARFDDVGEAGKEAAEKVDDAWKDLGLTFESAFESALVEGAKLADILKSIERDILRIVTRKLVTEPIGSAVSSFVKGMLPGFANGGSFEVGAQTSMGTLNGIDNRLIAFAARDGERVTVSKPGQAAGGGTVIQNFNFPPGTDVQAFQRSRTQIARAARNAMAGL